jgi:hypothetical protein
MEKIGVTMAPGGWILSVLGEPTRSDNARLAKAMEVRRVTCKYEEPAIHRSQPAPRNFCELTIVVVSYRRILAACFFVTDHRLVIFTSLTLVVIDYAY